MQKGTWRGARNGLRSPAVFDRVLNALLAQRYGWGGPFPSFPTNQAFSAAERMASTMC